MKKTTFFIVFTLVFLNVNCNQKSSSMDSPKAQSVSTSIAKSSNNVDTCRIELHQIEPKCSENNFFVIAEESYLEDELKNANGILCDVIVKNQFKNSGYAPIGSYQGDGMPASLYSSVDLIINDSAEATSANQKLPGSELMKDTEGYYQHAWILRINKNIKNSSSDSLKSALQAQNVNFKDMVLNDATFFLIFDSCLSESVAQNESQKIQNTGLKTKVVKLQKVEEDI